MNNNEEQVIKTCIFFANRYTNPDDFIKIIHSNYITDKTTNQKKFFYTIGGILYNNFFYHHAIRSFKECLKFINRNSDDDRKLLINCFIYLGAAYRELAEFSKALDYHNKALKIAIEINDNVDKAICYFNLGTTSIRLSDYKQAIEDYTKSLHLFLTIGDRDGECKCYSNLGVIYSNFSDLPKALDYHNKALKIAIEINDRYGELSCYGNLGELYRELAEFSKALDYHNKALKIAIEINDRKMQSFSYGNLGIVYTDLSNYPEAIEYYTKALQILLIIGYKEGILKCYSNLGAVYRALGDYPKAIDHYTKALQIAKEISDRFGESICYVNLGASYNRIGDYPKAIDYHNKALQIAIEIGSKSIVKTSYSNLAVAYSLLSDYPKAIDYNKKAFEIAVKIQDRTGQSSIHKNFGIIYNIMGELDKAYYHYKKSIELNELIGSNLVEDEHKIGFNIQTANIYELTVQLCLQLGKKEEAFEYVERSKSKAFIDLMSTSNIKPTVQDNNMMNNLYQNEQPLLIKKYAIQNRSNIQSFQQTPFNLLKEEEDITSITNKLNILYDKMQEIDPEYVSLRRPKHLKLSKVQNILKENNNSDSNSLLIEYFMTFNKLFIFIVTKDQFYVKQIDISPHTIYKFIDNYQQEVVNYTSFIDNDEKNITNTWLYELSKYLIEPILPYLSQNVNLIYFIPHNRLHYIPLHALFLTNDKEPLIKNYKIHYISSASLLQFFYKEKANKIVKTCTSIGIALNEQEQEFLEEAKIIAEIFNTKAKLNVTKKWIFNSTLADDVLHFSCHGYFYPEDPLSSGIVLKDEEYLTARDIFDKNIKLNSKLVTLSACETGISQNKPGDELIGLTRSLLYAGAQSLVVSLWKVSARAALEIMIAFYTNLKNGDDKAMALQKAQMKIRDEWKNKWGEKYEHPYWWAPFVLVGDWR